MSRWYKERTKKLNFFEFCKIYTWILQSLIYWPIQHRKNTSNLPNQMTQRLYLDLNFMSRRDAYYLFYKNYPKVFVEQPLASPGSDYYKTGCFDPLPKLQVSKVPIFLRQSPSMAGPAGYNQVCFHCPQLAGSWTDDREQKGI